jgi:hypothetical protein
MLERSVEDDAGKVTSRVDAPQLTGTGVDMPIQQTPAVTWKKSSRSHENGACVEVSTPAAHSIAVRDSKDPQGPVLTFQAEAWAAFVADIGQGAYDLG